MTRFHTRACRIGAPLLASGLAFSTGAHAQQAAASLGDAYADSAPVAPAAGASASATADVNPAPPPPAFTDTILPSIGTNPASGDVRSRLLDAFGDTTPVAPPGDHLGPNWELIPVLTVAEEWTDNAGLAAGGTGFDRGGSDFITLFEPQLTLLGNTERLQVYLHYAPVGEIYASNSDFSQFNENFDGDVLATVLPGWLYFDVRGAISQQPVFGGLGFFNDLLVGPNDRETVSSFSASPYVTHTFGGTGTLRAGVGYLYSATDAPGYLNTPGQLVPIATSYNYGSSWLATRRAFASFTTGSDFARFQDRIGFDASWYDGSGELRDGRRILATDDLSFALNRVVSLLGEIGYEDMNYPQAGFRYSGPIGAAGIRLTPSSTSTITAEYRYIDGFGSPYIYGSWQVTPRIRLFGGYSEGITTFDQDQQTQLLAGDIGPSGLAGTTLIAAPLLSETGIYGSNQALNKVRRLDASVAYIGNRDTVTAAFDWEHSTIVGNPYGLPTSVLNRIGLSDPALVQFGILTSNDSTNYTAGVNWVHELTPTLTSAIYGGYDHSRNASVIDADASAVLFSASLSKLFTNSLSGAITYSGTYFVDGTQTRDFNSNSNAVTVSVTKRF